MSDVIEANVTDGMTKRQVKRAYIRAEIGLSDAIPALMFDHRLTHGEALAFLGL